MLPVTVALLAAIPPPTVPAEFSETVLSASETRAA
jgi:hypothetical protein